MIESNAFEFWNPTSVKISIIGSGVMGKGIRDFFDSQGIVVELMSARSLLESTSRFSKQLSESELIIECCQEDVDMKKNILKIISLINPDGVIGTCTSSISVSELQNSVENPERFCGIHFMNPPRAISVVELIAGSQTSQHTLANTKQFLLGLDREVFEILDSPGFVVNSVLISMLNQSVLTLDACGLEPRELDLIIKKTTGLKLGPLATIDLIGVDVTVRIIENLHASNPKNFLPPATKLIKMLDDGILGRKTKIGFFEYP